MYSPKQLLKKIIAFLPSRWQKRLYDCYQYFRFLPRMCILKIRYKIIPILMARLNIAASFKQNINEIQSPIKRAKQTLIFNKDLNSIQSVLDSLFYLPTHQYNINGLKAYGTLRNRQIIFDTIAPNFFSGHNFLDIGCNTGFFSLLASQYFDRVQSIDNDKTFINLYELLKQPNMDFFPVSFRDFIPQLEFDRIFIGNVHHYIFTQCKGWEWIYKLAAISIDKVLIEGPVDMTCQDVNTLIPQDLQSKFTFGQFMGVMNLFFTLERKVPSVSQGRWVMLFKRKPDIYNRRFQLYDLPIIKILKADKESTVYLTKIENELAVAKLRNDQPDAYKINVHIASFSPISNGAIGSIYNNEKFVGWLETYEDGAIYKYKENQVELFKLICDHMMFLAKLGYCDTDCATINFFKKNNKLFDKGTVYHIQALNEDIYGDSFENRHQGCYFMNMRNSYDIINEDLQCDIYKALKSKDPDIIEFTFDKIKGKI